MWAYILRRVLLMIPTLFGILLLNFTVVQFAPGGPVEQIVAQLRGQAVGATARFTGAGSESAAAARAAKDSTKYRGSRGIDPEFIKQLEKQFGFDQPAHVRFFKMVRDFLCFDFGNSFFRDRNVMEMIKERLPVSISLGLWSTLIIYLISIPLGIKKAVQDGTKFDAWTSGLVIAGNAIPGFLFAILLIIVFAGGRYLEWFPLRGLVSENWQSLSFPALVADYLWHMVLPVTAISIGGFATLTMLTKNSFMDQIHQQYVVTAYAKGLTRRQVLYGHVFRNAMLLVIAGFPSAFLAMFFTGSLLVEVIFNLNGLGRLGYEAAIGRDYPIMFGSLFIFSLMGLVGGLLSDLTYTFVDPRINFEAQG